MLAAQAALCSVPRTGGVVKSWNPSTSGGNVEPGPGNASGNASIHSPRNLPAVVRRFGAAA
jgi:hypothetical protein